MDDPKTNLAPTVALIIIITTILHHCRPPSPSKWSVHNASVFLILISDRQYTPFFLKHRWCLNHHQFELEICVLICAPGMPHTRSYPSCIHQTYPIPQALSKCNTFQNSTPSDSSSSSLKTQTFSLSTTAHPSNHQNETPSAIQSRGLITDRCSNIQ
jgi:hypothetical protein